MAGSASSCFSSDGLEFSRSGGGEDGAGSGGGSSSHPPSGAYILLVLTGKINNEKMIRY